MRSLFSLIPSSPPVGDLEIWAQLSFRCTGGTKHCRASTLEVISIQALPSLLTFASANAFLSGRAGNQN